MSMPSPMSWPRVRPHLIPTLRAGAIAAGVVGVLSLFIDSSRWPEPVWGKPAVVAMVAVITMVFAFIASFQKPTYRPPPRESFAGLGQALVASLIGLAITVGVIALGVAIGMRL